MVSKYSKGCTSKVRDKAKLKPLPTEEEVRKYFYAHGDAIGYSYPCPYCGERSDGAGRVVHSGVCRERERDD
jgi:hypothetical protein